MITNSKCLVRALPWYTAQLTPATRSIPPIRALLIPGSHSASLTRSQRQRLFVTSRVAATMATNSTEIPSSSSSSRGGEAAAEHEINFSANQPADLHSRLLPLLDTWELTPSKKGLRRDFVFKTFNSAWRFMDAVAQECKAQRHHPEWSNLYNRVTVEWTTHRPEGLSVKDVDMAEFCNRTADEIGLKA